MEKMQNNYLSVLQKIQRVNSIVLLIFSLLFTAVMVSILKPPFWLGLTIFMVYALSFMGSFVLKHEIRLNKIEAWQKETEKRLNKLEKE